MEGPLSGGAAGMLASGFEFSTPGTDISIIDEALEAAPAAPTATT